MQDGYSRTYTLTEDTLVNAARYGIDDVKTGNTVQVTAVVVDGKAPTASSVNDGTVRQAAGEKWGFKHWAALTAAWNNPQLIARNLPGFPWVPAAD